MPTRTRAPSAPWQRRLSWTPRSLRCWTSSGGPATTTTRARPSARAGCSTSRRTPAGSSGSWPAPRARRGSSRSAPRTPTTIWLADAARATGGRVVTLERDPNKARLARENLARAGVAAWVEVREGAAAETLAALPGPFDLVFLDADRASYRTYLELAVPRLAPGGLLVADNVVSHQAELEDFLARVKGHPELLSVTVPVGKGEEVALKLA